MRNKLDFTMRLRVPKGMIAALERIAETKSRQRGLHVGYSSIAREAIIAHIEEQERLGIAQAK